MKNTIYIILLFAITSTGNLFASSITESYANSKFNPTIIKSSIQPTDTIKPQLFQVVKNDGHEYVGEILSDDGREVLLNTTALGNIYIPKSDIRSIVKIHDIEAVKNNEYYSSGPFTTRYAFTTNALPVKKFENYALINLYGPEVHFAVSDHLNIGLMSTWIASPFVFAAKYSFKTSNENINLSVGTLLGTSGYLYNFRGYGGLHFANVTFGDAKTNLTFSGGYGHLNISIANYYIEGTYTTDTDYLNDSFDFDENQPLRGPIFSVAGIVKVGAKASFVFDSMLGVTNTMQSNVTTLTIRESAYDENYNYIPGEYRHTVVNKKSNMIALFIMPGMRFQTKNKTAFQISLTGVSAYSKKIGWRSTPLPMVTWFYSF